MNAITRDFPPGGLRVSDADRDGALAELSEHLQAGRLTAEEFDQRSGQALRARTGGQLADLFTDLPVSDRAAGPASGADIRGRRWPLPISALRAALVVACLAVLATAIAGLGSHGLPAIVPVLALFLIIRRLTRRSIG